MAGDRDKSISGKLVRNFTLTSGVAVFFAILLVGLVQYHLTDREISAEAERYNEALASSLSILVADKIKGALAAPDVGDGPAPMNASLLAALDQVFARIAPDTRVLKVKLFDLKGTVIYSTTHADIGDTRYDNPSFRRALDLHQTASDRSFRSDFAAIGGPVTDRYVLSSYLPISLGGARGQSEGIFEIYSDVTEPVRKLHWILAAEFGVALTLIGLAYGVQLLVVLRGAREIDRAHQERLDLIALSDTRMQQMIEARAASKAKSTFLAMMSHELRTPLNAIIGFSELMKNETLGPIGNTRYREYMTHIAEGGTHLLGIVNDVLDLTKVEAGAYRFYPEAILVSEVLDAVQRMAGPLLQQKSITLTVSVAPGLQVFADGKATRQILTNLLGNAIKFTPAGGTIGMTGSVSPERQAVEIRVEDHGSGISPDDLARVTEPFYQAGNPYQSETSGTGLGLPVSRAFARGMGGDLEIVSQLGVGTTVSLFLPAEASTDLAATRHDSDAMDWQTTQSPLPRR
ncbi:MAG: HAMP domain-containing histidine kinase [Rhodospirillaceae bacterium]|nr:HAMP domain-containing histidine kinase [Rhodospirillaceae bacterium]